MYASTEDTSDVEEDFFNALALLHSTEEDSAEELRKMLDATIERKYGVGRTLMARMPKKFLQNSKIHDKPDANDTLGKQDDVESRKRENAFEIVGNLSIFVNDTTENCWKSVGMFDSDVEDYSERGDIPRISIPDEGSGDGLLCKVCNGANLGPLILLECQECQEAYHPLCHQPPVVDNDVYDPRIVWICKNCVDSSSANSAIAFEEKNLDKCYQSNDANEPFVKTNKSARTDTNHLRNELKVQAIIDGSQRDSDTLESTVPVKDSSYLNKKPSRTSFSNQLRKRIGSKLSVTRSIAK